MNLPPQLLEDLVKKQQRYFLRGPLVGLRPVEREDGKLVAEWINDPAVTHYMFYGQLPTNHEQAESFIMQQVASPQNTVFMVCARKTGKPIGFAGLYDIHPTARQAAFRVLIGERAYWGKGYGTEITEILTFYGFDRLNLHRIWLGVIAENKGAFRCYERAGYVQEGVLKDDLYRNSRYYDSLRMAMLRTDYYPKRHARDQKRFG